MAPTSHQLAEFERDPKIALLACAANSGQGRFLQTDHDFIITNNDAKIKEIKKEIENNLKKEDIGKIYENFVSTFNKDAKLFACGSCGMRGFEMGDTKTKCYHIESLQHLILTKDQEAEYLKLPEDYRKLCSVYKAGDGTLFHLHPELIEGEIVRVCQTCSDHFVRDRNRIPKLSLAAGIDFGILDRLQLPPPTLVEELLIAQSRMFVSLVKLVGPSAAQRQSAKKSHVITFPQPDGPTKLAELQRIKSHDRETYPRVENLSEHIAVCFLGSRLQFESMVPSFEDVQQLQVRVDVVYQHLHLLKSVNPLYRDIKIDESPAMRQQLEEIAKQLQEGAIMMDDEIDSINEMVANPDEALVEESTESLEQTGPISLSSSFVSRLTPLNNDPNKSTRDALEGRIRQFTKHKFFKNYFSVIRKEWLLQ